MIVCEHRIEYKYGQSFTLKPLFDLHFGNKYCDIKAAKAFLEGDENCILITGGDLADAIVTSDIRYRKHADDTQSDAIIDEQVKGIYDLIKPYKGRIIGIGLGNHESVIDRKCGSNISRRLAEKLDTISLGYSWIVKLVFTETKGGLVRTLYIRGHHGWGGSSRTQGYNLTAFSKDVGYWPCNLFLYGHVHRRQTDMIDVFGLRGLKLVPKPKHIIICGTFLRTFSKTDEPTYSEEKGYPPSSIGGVNVKITPTRNWFDIESDI